MPLGDTQSVDGPALRFSAPAITLLGGVLNMIVGVCFIVTPLVTGPTAFIAAGIPIGAIGFAFGLSIVTARCVCTPGNLSYRWVKTVTIQRERIAGIDVQMTLFPWTFSYAVVVRSAAGKPIVMRVLAPAALWSRPEAEARAEQLREILGLDARAAEPESTRSA